MSDHGFIRCHSLDRLDRSHVSAGTALVNRDRWYDPDFAPINIPACRAGQRFHRPLYPANEMHPHTIRLDQRPHQDTAARHRGRLALQRARGAGVMSHPLHNPADATTSWALNPWHPMSRPVDLKHLGKLAEELGEAQSAVARCIIQGIDESEPVTLKPNKVWLEDELADVLANIELVTRHFGLDRKRMVARELRKIEHLQGWHSMLEPER